MWSGLVNLMAEVEIQSMLGKTFILYRIIITDSCFMGSLVFISSCLHEVHCFWSGVCMLQVPVIPMVVWHSSLAQGEALPKWQHKGDSWASFGWVCSFLDCFVYYEMKKIQRVPHSLCSHVILSHKRNGCLNTFMAFVTECKRNMPLIF